MTKPMKLRVPFTFIHTTLLSLNNRWRVQVIQVNNFKFHQQQHPLNLHTHHTHHHIQTLKKAHHHLITIQHLKPPTHTIHRRHRHQTTRLIQCKVMQVIRAPATERQHPTIHRHRMERLIHLMAHLHHLTGHQ